LENVVGTGFLHNSWGSIIANNVLLRKIVQRCDKCGKVEVYIK